MEARVKLDTTEHHGTTTPSLLSVPLQVFSETFFDGVSLDPHSGDLNVWIWHLAEISESTSFFCNLSLAHAGVSAEMKSHNSEVVSLRREKDWAKEEGRCLAVPGNLIKRLGLQRVVIRVEIFRREA